MSVSATFIKRPIGTALLALALLLVGVAAYPLLPVAPLPQVDFPTIQVSASLPGASPETMASNVAQPLERQFSLIPGLTQMTSVSAIGNTQITLQFDLDRAIDGAALDVQAAMNAATGQLPTNMPGPPTYRKVNPADTPIMLITVQSDTLPLTQVNDYADNILAQQISQLSGVGQVNIGGVQKPAVRIQVDPARLSALGLSLEDLRGTIANLSVNQPKGTIDGVHQSYTVYTNDQLVGAARWNDAVLAYRNGAPIRVRDVGIAVDGPENVKSAGWSYNGAAAPAGSRIVNGRSIVLVIFKLPGANVIDTVDSIKAALPRLRHAIPPTVNVNILIDRTQTIRASLHDVQFTLALSVMLVVMVIFVFLRNVAATLIPSITVPLALTGTAAMMYLCHFSLDNLSLMALTISVGFVVDDAIVMLENIYRHVEDGMDPMAAALKGAGEIAFTIVSISISLVAVFIPLLLMGGIVGRLFREFAITVTLAIGVSVLVSLTLTPMLCSRYLHPEHESRHGRIYQFFERGFDALHAGYKRGLDFVLEHQFPTLLVFFATLALTVFLFIVIPKGFFPQQDTGYIFGIPQSSQDSSFEAMSKRLVRLVDVVRADPDVAGVSMFTNSSTYNTGFMFIALKPKDEGRKVSADDIINRLRPKLARVRGAALFMQAGQDINVGGRIARTQFQYTLTDANLDELNTWSTRLAAEMARLPELTDVASDLQNEANTATLTIDRDRAASF
ncbi:MAG: efflux RND transporter permease subunit, partial [Burkholderiales bacterium]|nr:efflux RND transporter permease subunit [Burkholderiales bacterium]